MERLVPRFVTPLHTRVRVVDAIRMNDINEQYQQQVNRQVALDNAVKVITSGHVTATTAEDVVTVAKAFENFFNGE